MLRSVSAALGSMRRFFLRLFPCQQDDSGEDADGAEEVGGGEGDVEQGDGEQDGGEGFGGAEDAGLGGLDVLEAAEVADKGDDSAKEDDVGKVKGGGGVPDAAEGPGLRDGQEQETADKHAPADDERRAVLADQALRLDGVEGRGEGAEQAPEQGGRRDGEARQAAVRHEQEGAEHGERDAGELAKGRPPARAQRGPADDDDRHEVLENRAGRGVAELDGGEVGVLDAEHAEDGEGNRLEAVTPPAEDHKDVLPVDGEVDEQQQGARDEHAHADEPFRREGAVLQDVLTGDARAAPEDGARQGECDAAAARRRFWIGGF